MPVEEVKIIENRCYRCRMLLSTKRISEAEKNEWTEETVVSESVGPFLVRAEKKEIISYKRICPTCYSHLLNVVKKMGKVDRTKRKYRAKKGG